ncbi:MAG: RodZ domain-containing protein, partial [candidate division Zixibacteria bacterium]
HIENGEVDKLPAALYFSLFAKSYSEALGIDYEATLQAIEADVEEESASPNGEAGSSESDQAEGMAESDGKFGFRKTAIWLTAVITILFAGVLISIYLFSDSTLLSGDDSESTGDVSDAGSAETSAYENYDFATPPSETPEPLTLSLVANEESWATILADGDTAVFRSLVPWREYTASASFRLRISVAWPSRVTIKLNGETVNLRDPETGRISRVQVDQINLQDYFDRPAYVPASRRAQPALQNESQPASVESTATTTPPSDGGNR